MKALFYYSGNIAQRYFRHYDKTSLRNRSFLSMTELILSSCACFHEKNFHFQLIFVEALSKIVYNPEFDT